MKNTESLIEMRYLWKKNFVMKKNSIDVPSRAVE